ncbi:DUF2326 domain-containing protein [Alkaliphilus transvaalensis]|uniref:DUF2326 domain-containing protein n=1 Tax=Alkaliphilus transvaalensis TaxID=114628 RepID=UPI00047ED785|nr:DUF2326 domain-containing protein [Alkaliphilus transvaalensis]
MGELKEKVDNKNIQIKSKKISLSETVQNRTSELNNIYSNIISYITNKSRYGSINVSNYNPLVIKPEGIIDNGAAMRNLAIIAFDIALLELALENNEVGNYYPKFLIHDSPKHNDMQIEMYKNIFDYLIMLENKYIENGRVFQYIITTLDISSSVEKQFKEYVRLTLDNSGDGGKLFGCDVEI